MQFNQALSEHELFVICKPASFISFMRTNLGCLNQHYSKLTFSVHVVNTIETTHALLILKFPFQALYWSTGYSIQGNRDAVGKCATKKRNTCTCVLNRKAKYTVYSRAVTAMSTKMRLRYNATIIECIRHKLHVGLNLKLIYMYMYSTLYSKHH